MPLSDTAIKKSLPADKPYTLTDSGGLYLLVMPTGGKLWRWSYRFEKKERLMALGKYPDVPLAVARARHAEGRRLLATGVDPMAERKAQRTAEKAAVENSFQSVANRWLQHWQGGVTPRHMAYVKRRMEADILPSLGPLPIAEIEAPEIVVMVKAIEGRGARDIAKRALETTGQVFRYAIAHGFCRRNPAAEIRPSDVLKATRKVNYARIEGKELPNLLRAIEVYRGKHITRFALKLMALTFVRTTELIEAKWEEIDTENARWNIPAERMKMRTPHIVPLAKQTLETLEMLRHLSGNSQWLFPGERSERRPMSNNTILKALERMGYKGEMTGHGFRGLASTLLHEQGYNHDHIELQLAHAPRNAVSAAYNHALYLAPRANMMQDWADFLEQTMKKGKLIQLETKVA